MLNELSKEIHANAVAHGWWDEAPDFATVIALELQPHRHGGKIV